MTMNNKEKKSIAFGYTHKGNISNLTVKGKHNMAEQIIELAKECSIPILDDKDLVKVLSTLDVGYEIPENLYRAMAEVIAFVYLANEKNSSKIDKV